MVTHQFKTVLHTAMLLIYTSNDPRYILSLAAVAAPVEFIIFHIIQVPAPEKEGYKKKSGTAPLLFTMLLT